MNTAVEFGRAGAATALWARKAPTPGVVIMDDRD